MPEYFAKTIYLREAWRRRDRFLRFSPQKKMVLPGTDTMIALVGADGSGKTSHASDLQHWLGEKLQVRQYYMGSKQPSLLSRLLYLAFRAGRKSSRSLTVRFGEASSWVRISITLRQALRYLHEISIGMDRYRRYRRAVREQKTGTMVLFDRFPLKEMLDGPQIALLAEVAGPDPVSDLCSVIERRLYARMQPPSLIWLGVTPEVAAGRKPDHNISLIESKTHILEVIYTQQSCSGRELRMQLIDANRSYADVSLELKQRIWSLI